MFCSYLDAKIKDMNEIYMKETNKSSFLPVKSRS